MVFSSSRVIFLIDDTFHVTPDTNQEILWMDQFFLFFVFLAIFTHFVITTIFRFLLTCKHHFSLSVYNAKMKSCHSLLKVCCRCVNVVFERSWRTQILSLKDFPDFQMFVDSWTWHTKFFRTRSLILWLGFNSVAFYFKCLYSVLVRLPGSG